MNRLIILFLFLFSFNANAQFGLSYGMFFPETPPGTYTRGDYVAANSAAFEGGCLIQDSIIIFAPSGHTYVGIYNVNTDTYTNGDTHEPSPSFEYATPVQVESGDIIFTPRNSDYVGIYDYGTDTYSQGDAHGEADGAFRTGVYVDSSYLDTGLCIFIPFSGTYVGIYNPVSDVYSQGAAHGEGSNAFTGGCVIPDSGKVIFAPYSSTYIGIYNPVTDTYKRGPAHGQGGGGAYWGAVYVDSRTVVLIPSFGGSKYGIYDPVDDTFEIYGNNVPVMIGGCLTNEQYVVGAPYDAATYVFNPITKSVVAGDPHGEGSGAFDGAVLHPSSGKIIFVPLGSDYVGIYEFD